MKASAFRRWPVAGAYSPEQTTRLTGGSDLFIFKFSYFQLFIYSSVFISNHSLIQANIHLFAYLSIYPFNFKHSTVYTFNSKHATFYTFIFKYSVIDFFSSILQSIHFLERNFLCLNLVYLP